MWIALLSSLAMLMMMGSPFLAIVLCVAIFSARVRLTPSDRHRLIRDFILHVIVGAGIGLAGALAFVIAATVYYNSGAGPLALILYGPLAASIGAVAGSIVWQRRSRPIASRKP